jgi:hypothetical protein
MLGMTHRQYTECVGPANYIGLPAHILFIVAYIIPLLLIAGFVPGISLAAVLAIIAYCRWWLYGRLVCLDGDRCAVGLLVGIYLPEEKEGLDRFDTDYSIDLLLAPSKPTDLIPDILAGFQAELIRETSTTNSHDWDFEGHRADVPCFPGAICHLPALHCEFEGGGVYRLYLAALAALPFAAAAAVVCNIPVFGWVACLILGLFVAAILTAGIISALNDKGDPADVNPALGELHRYEDILLVRGTWVYDSAHEGWNELHPIKDCQRVGLWSVWVKMSPATIQQQVDKCCAASFAAANALTIANQSKPENRWDLHPVVDGCEPESPDSQGPRIDSVSNVSSYNNCFNNYTVSASATDQSGIDKIELWYKFSSGSWQTEQMVWNSSNGLYEAIIQNTGSVTYFIRVYNIGGKLTDSTHYSTLLFCVA